MVQRGTSYAFSSPLNPEEYILSCYWFPSISSSFLFLLLCSPTPRLAAKQGLLMKAGREGARKEELQGPFQKVL